MPVTTPHQVEQPVTKTPCRVAALTPPAPGAVSILQLHGDIDPVLQSITGRSQWTVGEIRLCDLAGIDRGLVSIPAADTAQVMPHGGIRIRQRLLEAITRSGASLDTSMTPAELFPEARDLIEASAMQVMTQAASPLAIDLLLQQSERWADCVKWTEQDESRSKRLNRLIEPPNVVICGPANIGKSSLLNTLAGRDVAIAVDQPGTTRDYVSGLVELGGLTVRWHDTPGQRDTGDQIERDAIERSDRLITEADMLISTRDMGSKWHTLERQPDLLLSLRCDLGLCQDADVCVSSVTGEGLIELVECVREHLVPIADLGSTRPWRFPGLEVPGALNG